MVQRDVRQTYGDDRLITLSLLNRCEWMDFAKARVRQRDHTCCRVELQGTAAQRYHTVDQRQVLGLEMMNVTEHLRLGVMGVENWVLEIF